VDVDIVATEEQPVAGWIGLDQAGGSRCRSDDT
jgi:hypothetical protein